MGQYYGKLREMYADRGLHIISYANEIVTWSCIKHALGLQDENWRIKQYRFTEH